MTRFALALLVFLGATVQCWSMAACPLQSCPEMGVSVKQQDDPDCNCADKDHDHDKGQTKDHHHGGAACCCSIGKADAAVASATPSLTLPVNFQAAILPHQIELQLPSTERISTRIPFFGDSSPPIAEADPYQGRAPPVA